jgi:membrane protein
VSNPSSWSVHSSLNAAWRWVRDLYVWLERTRAFGLAAETAFWLFLALIPLLAILGVTAAKLSINNWESVAPILISLPPAAQALLSSELVAVAQWDGAMIGFTGALGTLWLASSGVHAIFDALQVATAARRPWFRQRLLSIATCGVLSIAVAALAVLGPGLDAAFGALNPWFPSLGDPTLFGRGIRGLLGFVVVFAQTYLLYWVGVPAVVRRSMPLAVGAITATCLQVVLSFAYKQFVAFIAGGATYTTGLAIIGVVLIGLYLSVLALLIGAAVNRKLGGIQHV